MTRDPIRRRFGHGAARLAIGLPASAERLGALARTPIRLERRLTLVPFTTALLIVWLLATTDSPLPMALPQPSEIRIAVDDWPAPARPLPEVPAPERVADREAARPRPEPVPQALPRRIAKPAPPTPLAATPRQGAPDLRPEPAPRPTREPSEPRAPFDLAALATRGASVSRDAILAGSRPVAPSAATQRPRGAQSTAGSAPSKREAEFAVAAGRGSAERRAQLAALDRTVGSANASAGSAPTSRRPQVSAARGSESLFATSSGRGDLDGWQEVPLDELPDCDPPGRQDLLKKRILLAASFSQECSHASGSYRFVETRTLGAFLMWSRSNPDREAGQPRDRDACDVLERALACLGDPASQESKSR